MTANNDMLEGYMDGLDLDSPDPSGNRSHSYRHGFANGRRDRGQKLALNAVCTASEMRHRADIAMLMDERFGSAIS